MADDSPFLKTMAADNSLIFSTVVQLIMSVLARADGVYTDAQEYLQDILALVDPDTSGNFSNLTWLGSTAKTATAYKTPTIVPSVTDNTIDIKMGTVTRPTGITFGGLNTTVPVDVLTAPIISFIPPPTPSLPPIGTVPQPDLTFTYNESLYTSAIGTEIQQRILYELQNGSTGLTAAVESDIYSRESERDVLELQNTKDRVAAMWAESGMPMPDGVLISAMTALEIEYQNKYSDKSRDVRIETFKRADDNAKFIKDLAVKYEQVLMDYMSKYWDRQLKAAEGTLQYAVMIYEALIKYHSLYIERYKAEVEGYKGTVEGQATVAEAQAKVYSAETGYVIGKAEIGAKSIGLEIDKRKTDVQNGQLDVAVYDSDIKYEIADADIKAKEIQMQLEEDKTRAAVFGAEVQLSDVDSKHNIANLQAALQFVQDNLEILKLEINSAVAATSNVAQVTSTMVAGSLSALNANASIGVSESYNNSSSMSQTSNSTFVSTTNWA